MGRCCTVFGCRSGHKPTRHKSTVSTDRSEVVACPRLKRSVFGFPRSASEKQKWAAVIGRDVECLYYRNLGICDIHFLPDYFRAGPNKRGEDRRRCLLKNGSMPSVKVRRNTTKCHRPTLLATPERAAAEGTRHKQTSSRNIFRQ